MPKTIHTPRDELVCGKLDAVEDKLRELGLVDLLYLAEDIRHDCERMEAKLISRKEEAQRLAQGTPLFLQRPKSEVIREIRNRITGIRDAISDFQFASPGWKERTEPVEGLLTCGIVTLYGVVEELEKFEREQEAPNC